MFSSDYRRMNMSYKLYFYYIKYQVTYKIYINFNKYFYFINKFIETMKEKNERMK